MTEATVHVTGSSLPKRIRRARFEMGLEQKDFAERLGVSERTLRKWETGTTTPRVYRLQALSRLTQKPIAYFTESIPDEEL